MDDNLGGWDSVLLGGLDVLLEQANQSKVEGRGLRNAGL